MRRTSPLIPTLAIAAAAAAAGLYVGFARAMFRARDRLVGRSNTIPTSFGTMEYAVMGTGKPVLAIHGASGGFDQTLDMTGALAGRGYQLIAPSRFGYLRSSMPARPSVAKQADAYVELLDKLGIEKATLLGISAGAWSCLEFAVRHPGRCQALVLLVPASPLPAGTTIRGGALARAVFNSDFVAWLWLRIASLIPGPMSRMMLGTNPALIRRADPGERARVRQLLDHLLPVGPRVAGMNFDIGVAAAPKPCPIEQIECPVLAISAEDDEFNTARRARAIAARVRDGMAVVFKSGGHALVGRHGESLREVARFLSAVEQRPLIPSESANRPPGLAFEQGAQFR